jgi:hypothetical protein
MMRVPSYLHVCIVVRCATLYATLLSFPSETTFLSIPPCLSVSFLSMHCIVFGAVGNRDCYVLTLLPVTFDTKMIIKI